MGIYWYCITNP